MERKNYSKAPVSEVIMGVTWDDGFLAADPARFFGFLEKVARTHPKFQTAGPLPDFEIEGARVSNVLNPAATGGVLHRCWSDDMRWLVQVQYNKLYLNWVRGDDESVGDYPGFETVAEHFFACLNLVEGNGTHFKYLELTYQDRLQLRHFGDDPRGLMAVSFPDVRPDTSVAGSAPLEVSSSSIAPQPDLNGYASVTVNTGYDTGGNKIVGMQSTLWGGSGTEEYSVWFEKAHRTQYAFFRGFFSQEVLNQWQ